MRLGISEHCAAGGDPYGVQVVRAQLIEQCAPVRRVLQRLGINDDRLMLKKTARLRHALCECGEQGRRVMGVEYDTYGVERRALEVERDIGGRGGR